MNGSADERDTARYLQVHVLSPTLPTHIGRTTSLGVHGDEDVVRLVGTMDKADAGVFVVLPHGVQDQSSVTACVGRFRVDDDRNGRRRPMVGFVSQKSPFIQFFLNQRIIN